MTGARHRAQVGLVSLALLLGLAACTSGSDGATPASPSPTPPASTPVSSSVLSSAPSPTVSMPASLTPAEAKAATSAIEAYRQYITVSDQVLQGGGVSAALLRTVAVQGALTGAQSEAAIVRSRGLRSLGETTIARLAVRSVNLMSNPTAYVVPEVILDSCEDVSGVDLVDAKGASVRPKDAPDAWKTSLWVRHYPSAGGGVDGWIVARDENEGVSTC
jgi:hypothetical protein